METDLTRDELARLAELRERFSKERECMRANQDGSVTVYPGPARDYLHALDLLAPRLLSTLERRDRRVAELEVAFEKYAIHGSHGCPKDLQPLRDDINCTCGLDRIHAALAAERGSGS